MADYLPLFRPGQTVSFTAAADVTAGQLVEVGAADRTVAPAAAQSKKVVGVAGFSAKAGELLTVEVGKPVHELTAAGAIAAGDRVEAAANGAVATLGEGTAVGVALTAAADGAAVQVLAL